MQISFLQSILDGTDPRRVIDSKHFFRLIDIGSSNAIKLDVTPEIPEPYAELGIERSLPYNTHSRIAHAQPWCERTIPHLIVCHLHNVSGQAAPRNRRNTSIRDNGIEY